MEKPLCCYCEKSPATINHKFQDGREELYCSNCFESLILFPNPEILGPRRGKDEKAVCSHCGRTATEFFKTGIVGCANCYKDLAWEVKPTIVKMQGERSHCGRTNELSKTREILIEKRNATLAMALKAESNGEKEQAQEYYERLKELNGRLHDGSEV